MNLDAVVAAVRDRPAHPVRLAVDPTHPYYRPDAREWKPVLNGRVVGGCQVVDTVEGWAEGFRCVPSVGGKIRALRTQRILVRGPFELVHASRVPEGTARAWLHNMLGVVPIIQPRG